MLSQYINPFHTATILHSTRDPQSLCPQKFAFRFRRKTLHYVLVSLNFLLLNLLRENQWYKQHIPCHYRCYLSEICDHTENVLLIYGYVMHYSERFHMTMASD